MIVVTGISTRAIPLLYYPGRAHGLFLLVSSAHTTRLAFLSSDDVFTARPVVFYLLTVFSSSITDGHRLMPEALLSSLWVAQYFFMLFDIFPLDPACATDTSGLIFLKRNALRPKSVCV